MGIHKGLRARGRSFVDTVLVLDLQRRIALIELEYINYQSWPIALPKSSTSSPLRKRQPMTIRPIRRLIDRLKAYPLVARLDWRLYLLRDLWATKIWSRTRETLTPFGFKLTTRMHPAYELMRNGNFEPNETRIFVRLLEMVDVFVDIGANLGYYCCFALQRNKLVVAFEPQAQNLACLYQNLTSNEWQDKVEVYPIALSSQPGLLTLFGASGPSASLVKNWAGYSPLFEQIVPANTLDNVLASRFQGNRLIIKIDVEGAEFNVLEGALATVSRLPRPIWLIEVCLREYHPSGVNPDYLGIFNLFWDNGYRCFGADEKCTPITPRDVQRWLETGVRDVQTFNYVFIDQTVNLQAVMNAAG